MFELCVREGERVGLGKQEWWEVELKASGFIGVSRKQAFVTFTGRERECVCVRANMFRLEGSVDGKLHHSLHIDGNMRVLHSIYHHGHKGHNQEFEMQSHHAT